MIETLPAWAITTLGAFLFIFNVALIARLILYAVDSKFYIRVCNHANPQRRRSKFPAVRRVSKK